MVGVHTLSPSPHQQIIVNPLEQPEVGCRPSSLQVLSWLDNLKLYQQRYTWAKMILTRLTLDHSKMAFFNNILGLEIYQEAWDIYKL